MCFLGQITIAFFILSGVQSDFIDTSEWFASVALSGSDTSIFEKKF